MLLLASQRATILGVGIASVLCLGTILLKQGKTNQFIKASIVIIALVAIFLTLFDFEILNRFNDLNNYKSFERYSDYSIAWNAFKESNFLTGLGYGVSFLYWRISSIST